MTKREAVLNFYAKITAATRDFTNKTFGGFPDEMFVYIIVYNAGAWC